MIWAGTVLLDAGWEITVCPREPVPWSAITQHLANVWRGKSHVTWELTVAAGWETSAWLRASRVLQFATFLLLLFARKARSCATWVLMLIIVGWETTVCQPGPNAQPLQEFKQIPDVSI